MCQVKGAGKVVETIYKYDDERRELAFILEGQKIPFFMRKIDNTWSVKPIPVNESRAIFSTKKSVISVSPCSIACASGSNVRHNLPTRVRLRISCRRATCS